MKRVGSTMSLPAPGNQGSTPGLAAIISVAQIILGAQIGEGVFVFGLDDLHLPHDVFAGRRQRKPSAWTELAAHRAASDRQRVTAGMRDNIREILRVTTKEMEARTEVYTGPCQIGDICG